jgi:hypothetical protein
MITAVLCAGYAALVAAVYYVYSRIVKKDEPVETRTNSPVQFAKDMLKVVYVFAGKAVADVVLSLKVWARFRKDRNHPELEDRLESLNERLDMFNEEFAKSGNTVLVKRVNKYRSAIIKEVYCGVYPVPGNDEPELEHYDDIFAYAIRRHCGRSLADLVDAVLCGMVIGYTVMLANTIVPLFLVAAVTVFILDKYLATPAAGLFESLFALVGSFFDLVGAAVAMLAFVIALPFIVVIRLATGTAMFVYKKTRQCITYCYNKICTACESTRSCVVRSWNKLFKKQAKAVPVAELVDVPLADSITFGMPPGVSLL